MKVFLLFLFVSISCSNIESDINIHSRKGLPDQESWDVEITLTDEGVMRALVKAGHLEKFNERNYVFFFKKNFKLAVIIFEGRFRVSEIISNHHVLQCQSISIINRNILVPSARKTTYPGARFS